LTTSRNRNLIAVVALATIVAACGYLPGVGPGETHVAGTEEQPAPGAVVVVGAPPRAASPLVIEFVGSDGIVVDEQTVRIPKDGIIDASMTNLPGPMALRVNGVLCTGDFVIESDQRTNVVLRVDDAGCSVERAE